MKKKLLCLLLALLLVLPIAACGDDPDAPDRHLDIDVESGTWSIYWYLCGSDLETNYGCATQDLMELMEVTLPENVRVVIQTGGAKEWQNNVVNADILQRYVYDSTGLTLVDELPPASMGDTATLTDFLRFCKTYYPAEHTAVLFWNHGGGSVNGAAFDERYYLDSLTLDEMRTAFGRVWPGDENNPPLELVGFDTCLMATVDVVDTFVGTARYLVASEEVEPGNGWNYTGWAGALAEDPTMDGAALGRIICDTYYAGCEAVGTQNKATLSLTDLTRCGPLLEAYEAFGAEALAEACEDPSFFSRFARIAAQSENYGGNTREQGYTNMVDLGHMARQSTGLLQTAGDVLTALEDCVLYRVNGPYRAEATGLSCYYSYNGDLDDLSGYAAVGAGEAFKHFYSYELTGELDHAGMQYIADLNYHELPDVPNLMTTEWDGMPLQVDENGVSSLTLGPEADSVLAGIGFSLYFLDDSSDIMLLLGTDNDMNADWENGIFTDNFRGVWGSIDGHLVYMELCFEGGDYNLYSIPILLGEDPYNLQVAYDFNTEEWSILGARPGIGESGMSDKELRLLQPGDVVTTVWYYSTISGDDGTEAYTAEEFTVTAQTSFYEVPLPNGRYGMVFEMRDAMGHYAYTEPVFFLCDGGEISTLLYN